MSTQDHVTVHTRDVAVRVVLCPPPGLPGLGPLLPPWLPPDLLGGPPPVAPMQRARW